jgi:hypothetical protein
MTRRVLGAGAFGRLLGMAWLVIALATPGGHGAKADGPVDVQLVLAVDTSGSVSPQRFELQKQGYIAAFRDARLLRAIQSGTHQAIAVTMIQWTGPAMQARAVPWLKVRDEPSMHAVAAAIEGTPRLLFGGGTSISGAIDYGVVLLNATPFAGGRRVIDISGDGPNNRGRPATDARDDAVRAGISINGLPILALEPRLDQYYWDNVVGGPGAFVIAAESYETFAEAVLKKLIVEIAGLDAGQPLHRNAGWCLEARISRLC